MAKSEFYIAMILVSKMIYKYSELLKKRIYTSDVDIKKAITNSKLFKIDFGLYSDKKINSKLEIISKKYENYIFKSGYEHQMNDKRIEFKLEFLFFLYCCI